MKRYSIFITLLWLLLLCKLSGADHSVLTNNEFNSVPDSNAATFRSRGLAMWDHEHAQREGRYHLPFIVSGGIPSPATSSTLTTATFATEAFVPERINQSAAAITYTTSTTNICHTIVSSDNDGITNWTRVGATAYYFQCQGEGATTPTNPVLPANSAWLLRATITGGAITTMVRHPGMCTNPRCAYMSVKDPLFGATGDGLTDDTTAINAAFSAGNRVHFPYGTYRHTAMLSMVKSDYIEITADPGTIIRGIGTGYTGLWIGGVATTYDPSVYTSGVAISNATKGDASIVTALSGVAAGDILRLTSSDIWYASGRSGELVEVDSVSGTTLTLTKPLFDTYTGANTVAIRQDAPTIHISNLRIERDANDIGLAITWGRNLLLESVHVVGARYTGVSARFIYGGEIRNCSSRDIWYTGSGTSYGLTVATSQGVHIHSNNFNSGRHALSLTNYEPNRFITISGNTLTNKTSETNGALNVHGGSEYITIANNHIHGGLDVSLTNLTFTGNTVIGVGAARPLAWFVAEHASSDYTTISNNTFLSTATSGGQAVVWVHAEVNAATLALVQISHNQIIGEPDFTHGVLFISPFSDSLGRTFTIARLELIGNDVTNRSTGSALSYAFLSSDNTGGDGFYPVLSSVIIRDGRYFSASNRAIGLLNLNTVTKNGSIFIDTTATAGSNSIYIDGASYATVKGIITGGGNIYAANISNVFSIDGAKIFDAAAAGGISIQSTVTESILANNYFSNVTGTPSDLAAKRSTGAQTATRNTVSWGSATPTTGTWTQGDVVWNTGAAAGQPAGWVCTVSGTPGTWRSMATL